MQIDSVVLQTKTQATIKAGPEESCQLMVNSCGYVSCALKLSKITSIVQYVTKFTLTLAIMQRQMVKNGFNVRAVPSGNIPNVKSMLMVSLIFPRNCS